jgi:hypothetical protein
MCIDWNVAGCPMSIFFRVTALDRQRCESNSGSVCGTTARTESSASATSQADVSAAHRGPRATVR